MPTNVEKDHTSIVCCHCKRVEKIPSVCLIGGQEWFLRSQIPAGWLVTGLSIQDEGLVFACSILCAQRYIGAHHA